MRSPTITRGFLLTRVLEMIPPGSESAPISGEWNEELIWPLIGYRK